jgi:hypothetical protein
VRVPAPARVHGGEPARRLLAVRGARVLTAKMFGLCLDRAAALIALAVQAQFGVPADLVEWTCGRTVHPALNRTRSTPQTSHNLSGLESWHGQRMVRAERSAKSSGIQFTVG